MSKEQYDSIAEEYSKMLNPTKEYVLIPTFKALIGPVKDKSALDLACGDGFFTRILANLKTKETLGIDYSTELIKIAIQLENQQKLGITYKVDDALTLKLQKQFDLITAVYLLNYCKSITELELVCKNIFTHLAENGLFLAITINPLLKPMPDFEYGRRFTSLTGQESFKDKDQVKTEIQEEGKVPFEFISYYWSKETYELCFSRAGFKSLNWVNVFISKDGIRKYGRRYWQKFIENPSAICIICRK